MLYLRTASGDFVNAATIVQLSPQRGGSGDEITGWVAIGRDGHAVALAAYYVTPGRIEKLLELRARNSSMLPEALCCRSSLCSGLSEPLGPNAFTVASSISISASARAAPTATKRKRSLMATPP
jgi:hypothetical protein